MVARLKDAKAPTKAICRRDVGIFVAATVRTMQLRYFNGVGILLGVKNDRRGGVEGGKDPRELSKCPARISETRGRGYLRGIGVAGLSRGRCLIALLIHRDRGC